MAECLETDELCAAAKAVSKNNFTLSSPQLTPAKKSRSKFKFAVQTVKRKDKTNGNLRKHQARQGTLRNIKGFLAELESIDPSENYKGTSLEGLDAFERQLKRFDIRWRQYVKPRR